MQTDQPSIRLLIADACDVIRAGLQVLLRDHPRLRVVGSAGSVSEALQVAGRCSPDVIVTDLVFPDGSGFDLCRALHQQKTIPRFLIYTWAGDDESLQEAIAIPVDGYLLKNAQSDELASAVERLQMGQSILDPAVTRRVFERLKSRSETAQRSKLHLLSPQEKKILAHLSQGRTNKEIAVQMGLSDKTVKNYLANAMKKLQMSRRSQVTAYFVRYQRDRA